MARPPRPGTRRSPLLPGRADGRIVGWPMLLLWLIAAATTAWIQQDRPEQVPALLALYLCGGFFAQFYALLFMAGSQFRRVVFAGLVTGIFVLLIVHHADEMPGRRVVTGAQWVELPTRPAWIVPILCDLLFLVLLWVHALWLAFGTRPKPGWRAAGPDAAPAEVKAPAPVDEPVPVDAPEPVDEPEPVGEPEPVDVQVPATSAGEHTPPVTPDV